MKNKQTASLSLDLDNKWAYLKTHGDENWDSLPSYLDIVVPRFLDLLNELELKCTVFVVGQDAAVPGNRSNLLSIAEEGHEIGNHSFHHEPWLHLYTPQELDNEFRRTEEAIEQATGQKPVGFRGPGFSLSNETLKLLIRRGYQYDCSTFPTFLGPLARAYYFMRSSFSRAQKQERKELFGKMRDGFQSNSPYQWNAGDSRLIEIPVTTFPVLKTPIHLSYLIYLSRFSKSLAKSYFWAAMKMARLTGIGPSLLLHPLDFLGVEDEQDLSFFPGMELRCDHKIDMVRFALEQLKHNFAVGPLREHALVAAREEIPSRDIESAVSGVSAPLVKVSA